MATGHIVANDSEEQSHASLLRHYLALIEDARPSPAITRSPSFQRWFAGSKIVDAAGQPMVLYHGTSKDVDFKKFKVPGNGAWFINDPAAASTYAIDNDTMNGSWRDRGDGQGMQFSPLWINQHTGKPANGASRVMPVYIRALNPYVADDWPDSVKHAGRNGRGGDPTPVYRRAQREWFDQLRRAGHDAVVFEPGDGSTTVVVLSSANQIKSAIGNTQFDPAKPNLHEARDLLPLTATFLRKVRANLKRIDASADWPASDAALRQKIREVLARIDADEPIGPVMTILRAELRPRQILPNGVTSVGIHWCWDEHAPQVYHSDNAYDDAEREGYQSADLTKVTLVAEVRFKDIDWAFTIATNLRLPGEAEITVRSGAAVKLTEIFYDGTYAMPDRTVVADGSLPD